MKKKLTTEIVEPVQQVKRKAGRPRGSNPVGVHIPPETIEKAEQVAQIIAPAYQITGLQAVIGAVAFANATIIELLRQQQVGE